MEVRKGEGAYFSGGQKEGKGGERGRKRRGGEFQQSRGE